ncbi:hypothetical protein DY245_16130 [Streptomyces inhibens]|uniref:SnoaL-like domain-containing protein n=1 Tax=Streptomyces inhibens TaxID=2293571 RepID=A0A371Q3R5_STRIH|nr:nuclear transport factor 2 family protein [Streptomyces inhibens]REK89299.1 hypothetical protein DY245_16130 [Streptomyces inhibens]
MKWSSVRPRARSEEGDVTDGTGYESLAVRLQVLEDKEALRALMINGWRALDRKDWLTWIDCWSPDAVLAFEPWGEPHGKDALRTKVVEAESSYAAMASGALRSLRSLRLGSFDPSSEAERDRKAEGRPPCWAYRGEPDSAARGCPRALKAWGSACRGHLPALAGGASRGRRDFEDRP